ncbi:excisionase family DNA-binding protein [Allocoleopsis sp.]|uniref:excisionase family DNA-binding protein n=1 Tax=Allocoleopsis sp. TaxID=3088169 RepID=UPI002FD64022
MTSRDLQPEPVVATEQEQTRLAKLEELLSLPQEGKTTPRPRLCTSTDQEVELPESVMHLLRQLVHQLVLGKGVLITTFHQPLTIWEAATLLNVQSKDVEQLLDTGTIPFSQAGMLRRIRFEDLMAYRTQQTELRWQDLAERTLMSQPSKSGE